jgi:hypothetical protein
MVRLDELPLSPALKKRLRSRAARSDRLVETNYEWPTATERTRWVDVGRSLCQETRAELGPSFDVEYFHGTESRRLVSHTTQTTPYVPRHPCLARVSSAFTVG